MIDINDKLAQQIAFSKARGICGATARVLLERIGDVSYFFTLSQGELHRLSGINAEAFTDEYRHMLLEEAEHEAANIRAHHIDTLFIDSDDYPKRLLNCEDAPVLLYRWGSCNLDKTHVIGIVGTRSATPYGIDFTTRLVAELAEKIDDLLVISGLAYGIDIAAHMASIANNIPTVAVMAHGLHTIYPAVHRQTAIKMSNSGGALITEYPMGTTAHRNHFLARNRIVAGLSDCLVVVESDYRGGSMSTARMAMQYDREVFAVPGRITDRYSQGTNRLISNNTAALIQSADDIIEHMGWTPRTTDTESETPQLFRPLSADEQALMEYIADNPDSTINDICVNLGKSYAAVSDLVFQLEIDDLIITLPGGRFAPTTKK